MIVFENVDKAYKNKQVLTNVNLTINSGGIYGINRFFRMWQNNFT